MIGIVKSIAGLATTIIDSKAKVKAAEAETKMKLATGEISWEQAAIEASKDSWKEGFENLKQCPAWVSWGMYASIAASFGIRTMRGFGK